MIKEKKKERDEEMRTLAGCDGTVERSGAVWMDGVVKRRHVVITLTALYYTGENSGVCGLTPSLFSCLIPAAGKCFKPNHSYPSIHSANVLSQFSFMCVLLRKWEIL